MVEDGEDSHGLQTTNFKNFSFKILKPLRDFHSYPIRAQNTKMFSFNINIQLDFDFSMS